MSNNQVLGWIQLTADGNPELRDQTNREGLVVNEAYRHLQQLVLELLGYLESRRFSARRSMNFGSQKRLKSLPTSGAMDDELTLALNALDENGSVPGDVGQLRQVIDRRETALTDAVRQYASLATVGQLSGMVVEQLQQPVRQLLSEARVMEADLSDDELDVETVEDLRESVAKMRRVLETMGKRMKTLDPLAGARKGIQLSRVSMRACVEGVVGAYRDTLNQHGVAFSIEGDDTEVLTDPAILQQALAHILDNAIYWSRKADAPHVKATLTPKGVVLSNNGPPVLESDFGVLFEPHFTRREDRGGFGLTLARELMSSLGGDVCCTGSHSGGVSFATTVS